MTNKILQFTMLVLGDINRFFSDLVSGIFSKKYQPYIREIEIYEGPINIKIVGLEGDANSELLHQMFKDVSMKYPITVNYIPDMKRTGNYPKVYVENQLKLVGMVGYDYIDLLVKDLIEKKKALVEKRINEINETKRKTDFFIVYSTPLFTHERTEILIPSQNIIAREKNLRLDIRIKRDGLPNSSSNRNAIMNRNQVITDFRGMDGAHPEEILEIAAEGVVKTF